MIVSPEYCQIMARYNAWQNAGLRDLLKAQEELDFYV